MKKLGCDGCGVIEEGGNYAVLIVAGQVWTACSGKCAKAALEEAVRGGAVLPNGGRVAKPSREQVRQDEATLDNFEGHQNEPPTTCAACRKGTAYTPETAYLHTGLGVACSMPTTAAGLDTELARLKAIRDEEELVKLRQTESEKPKRKNGRKNGSLENPLAKAKTPPGPTVLHDTVRFVAENPGVNPNDLTQDQITVFNAKLQMAERQRTNEPPRWCKCGRPVVMSPSPFGRGVWECSDGHKNAEGLLTVNQGEPGENLSQLLTDCAGKGLKLSLVDVATWPVMKRHVLRAWVQQGGDLPDDFFPGAREVPVPSPAANEGYAF
jgi:hypothetical protein